MTESMEARRAALLKRLSILDTEPEPAFDAITGLAKTVFATESALVSLLDGERQWFKSRVGLEVSETARSISICDHAARTPDAVFVVPDTRLDPRFEASPLVTGAPFIRFYAGAPMVVEGVAIGAVCLLDPAPRHDFGDRERAILTALATQAAELLRLRLEGAERRLLQRDLEMQSRRLLQTEQLAGVGHWSLDPASGRATWSDQTYRIHGLDPGTFDPQLDDALDFYEPQSRDKVAAHVAWALETGESFAFKARLRRVSDGLLRTVMSMGELRPGEGGEPAMLFGVIQDVTEQDALLQQVMQDGERYRLLTQNATDAIATYRPDGTFTYLSPAIESLIGYTPFELVGRKTYVVIHPDDADRVTREFAVMLKRGEASARIAYRAMPKTGEPIWVEAHPSPVYDASGALTGFQDVIRDVSARKAAETRAHEATERAEAALRVANESEARYRLLAENANDMMSTSTLDSTLLFVTPSVNRLLGYSPEEVIGTKTLDLTHPDDRERVTALFTALVLAGPDAPVAPYQFRGQRKDGTWLWLEGHPRVQFDAKGRPQVFQDVVRDVTARKEADDRAREAAAFAEAARVVAADSERRYRILADNSTDLIIRLGLDATILYASPASRLIGYEPEELVGMNLLALVHPDDVGRATAMTMRTLAGEPLDPLVDRVFRARRRDGSEIWAESAPSVVRDAEGRPVEVVSVLRDVTSRKALQDELILAKECAEAAAQAKADFLANMSHELRTPLTGILGYADVLAEQPDLHTDSRRYARLIGHAGRNLLTLVNDVLDLSKIEAGGVELAPEDVDLGELLREALDLVRPQAEAKGLRLHSDLPRRPDRVSLDPARLRQVLLNLLSNAVKFTEAGEVCLGLVSAPAGPGRTALNIVVRDTGIGIAPERIDQVFGRFEQADASITRRFGGTGLGLAISNALVERMGGAITVESEPGQGSTFTVRLEAPVVAETAPQTAAAPDEGRASLAGLRVLLAEDVAMNRELIGIFLGAHKVQLTGVENGEQAVAAAAKDSYDVILMDMQMPVLDGLEATRRIRRSHGASAKAPILALTANVMPAEIAKCRAAGMDGHIAKPFTADSVAGALKAAMVNARYL